MSVDRRSFLENAAFALAAAKMVWRIEVNGKAANVQPVGGVLEMRGQGGDGAPLRWSVLGG